MKISKLIVITILFGIYAIAIADTLTLKNGLVLEGRFKGGNEKTIQFDTSGKIQKIAIAEIESITFSGSRVEAQVDQSTAPSTGAAVSTVGAKSGTQIPTGTKLTIHTSEDVSTASHQAGAKFKCGLEADLILNGVLVAAKGSEIYGKVMESIGGRRVGNQRIIVTFDKIMLNGQLVDMETDDVGAEGGRGGAARAVGAGALIGLAAGDAGKGAAVGAGLALLAGGNHIQIPAGAILEVSLKQGIVVP